MEVCGDSALAPSVALTQKMGGTGSGGVQPQGGFASVGASCIVRWRVRLGCEACSRCTRGWRLRRLPQDLRRSPPVCVSPQSSSWMGALWSLPTHFFAGLLGWLLGMTVRRCTVGGPCPSQQAPDHADVMMALFAVGLAGCCSVPFLPWRPQPPAGEVAGWPRRCSRGCASLVAVFLDGSHD